MKCSECFFYKSLKEDRGRCHRYPPVADGRDVDTIDHYPIVGANEDGCGEGRKRK